MPCKRVLPKLPDLALLFPGPAETCPHPRLMILLQAAVIDGAKAQSGLRSDQGPNTFEQTTRKP